MSELERDRDTSRFDTEPLQLISKPYLTCKELEEYWQEAINEGKPVDDDDDNATLSVVEQSVIDQQNYSSKEGKERKDEAQNLPTNDVLQTVNPVTITNEAVNTEDKGVARIKFVTISEENNTHISFNDDSAHSVLSDENPKNIGDIKNDNDQVQISSEHNASPKKNEEDDDSLIDTSGVTDNDSDEIDQDEDARIKKMTKVLARQYFWTSAAAVSFVLGIGCLILSREIIKSDTKTRRWSRR